jgi:hypothetical protein
MAKLGTWTAEHGFQSEPSFLMKQAVLVQFADMERNGELD